MFEREPRSLRNMFATGGEGFLHDMIEAGGGSDVFVNDGRGDAAHGNTVAVNVNLGAGADTFTLDGGATIASLAANGGSGTDTFVGTTTTTGLKLTGFDS